MAIVRGGEKLAAKLADLARQVSNPGVLRAGFLRGATYPDGTPVAMVAAIQDYGAPGAGIPPRPFFRNVVANGTKTWPEKLAKILKANDFDAKRSLRLMGEMIKGEIQDSITNGDYAPLKEATVKRKGFDKPLIDTGHMLNSVDYEVT